MCEQQQQQQQTPVVKVLPFFLLQKHQQEVLAMVDQKTRSRRRSSEEENEGEGVRQAMRWSLSEGWSLLLHLLGKRQEVLQLAADFYHWLVEVQRLVNISITGIL